MRLCETLITAKTHVNPFSETSMLNLPSSLFVSLLFSFSFALAHCFGRLLSAYNRRSVLSWPLLCPFLASSVAVPHRPLRDHAASPGIRYMRGSLCFMANCFIIFDIFPVYGRGPTFCFMVVYCAWWTLLYVPPWILGLRPARVLSARYSRRIEYDKRHFLVIKKCMCIVCCRVSLREKKKIRVVLSRDREGRIDFFPLSVFYSLFTAVMQFARSFICCNLI